MAIDFVDDSRPASEIDPFAQTDNDTDGTDSAKFGSFFDRPPSDPYASTIPQDGTPMQGPNDGPRMNNTPTLFTDDNQINVREPAQGQDPQQPQQPQAPYDPRNDPKRIEYHQSRADRYRNQVEQVQPYVPIIEYLQNDPEALQYLEQRAMGRQQGVVPAQTQPMQQMVAPPEAPKAPEKPATFNIAESLTPGTESFAYREAMEKYQLDRLDFMEKTIAHKDQVREQQIRQFQQRQQVEQMMQGVRQTLQAQYGAQPADVEEFIQRYSDPRSVTLENLWKLHQLEKPQLTQGAPQTPAGRIQQERANRQRNPVPIPGSGNPPTPRQTDPNQKWNMDVIGWDRNAMERVQGRRNQR